MPSSPQVSIVMPVFNDESWITAALASALGQSLRDIEVICVDDASTDGTCAVIEQAQRGDPRIRLIRQEQNQSAFQARRLGIEAASAPYVLFLDGDDELSHDAAAKTLERAQAAQADLVGFGVRVISTDGRPVSGFQARLQPTHPELVGDAIMPGLFPAGEQPNVQLWRYLFSTELLLEAYAGLPDDLVLPRGNDLPITFLAVAAAKRYVSIPAQLYRYQYGRGGSGNRVADLPEFEFHLGGIDSVESIKERVHALAKRRADPRAVLASYDSARRFVIGVVLKYLVGIQDRALQQQALTLLRARVTEPDLILAAAEYRVKALDVLERSEQRVPLGGRPVRSILIRTQTLATGGVSGVVISQARHLLHAGYRVTVAVHRLGDGSQPLPDGVELVHISDDSRRERLASWAEICQEHAVDLVIEHRILHNRRWPRYAMMARALGIPTIGWVHNFSLRPIYDHSSQLSFIEQHADVLAMLVTLSPLDVAFWRLRGLTEVICLPNPPSPMLIESSAPTTPRPAPTGRIELVWWGRLEERTKQISQLLAVAGQLRDQSVDFRLTIIGPESIGFTAAELLQEVDRLGLSERVRLRDALHGSDLIAAIDEADVFVMTSIIEGYPLTLVEAQARGLPVLMYELPWLMLVQQNEGVVSVRQGDSAGLAHEIAALQRDPGRYSALSAASIAAAGRATEPDFERLYGELVSGRHPAGSSPEATLVDARQILDWTLFYAERSAEVLETEEPTAAERNQPKVPAPDRLRSLARRVFRGGAWA